MFRDGSRARVGRRTRFCNCCKVASVPGANSAASRSTLPADNSPICARPNAFNTRRTSDALNNSSHLPLAKISKRFRHFSWLTNPPRGSLDNNILWQEQKQLPPSCSLNVGFGSRFHHCHSHGRSVGTAKAHWRSSHHNGPFPISDGWRHAPHIRDFQWNSFSSRTSGASPLATDTLSMSDSSSSRGRDMFVSYSEFLLLPEESGRLTTPSVSESATVMSTATGGALCTLSAQTATLPELWAPSTATSTWTACVIEIVESSTVSGTESTGTCI